MMEAYGKEYQDPHSEDIFFQGETPDLTIVRSQKKEEVPEQNDDRIAIVAGPQRGRPMPADSAEETNGAPTLVAAEGATHESSAVSVEVVAESQPETAKDAQLPILRMPDNPEDCTSTLHRAIAENHVPYSSGIDYAHPATRYKVYAYPGGRPVDSSEVSEVFATVVEHFRERFRPEGSTPATDEEAALIRRLHDGFKRVGDELGVDIASRLPKMEHYHFFDSREALAQAVESVDPRQGPWSTAPARLLLRAGLLVARRDAVADEAAITHETGHDLDITRVNFELDSNAFPATQFSYSRLNPRIRGAPSSAMTEVTVEMAKDKARREAGSANRRYSYTAFGKIGAGILKLTAAKHDLAPYEVENMLIRGAWTGDLTGLALMTDTIGEDAATKFLRMGGRESLDDCSAFAAELGLREAKAEIDNRIAGGKFTAQPYDWDRPRQPRPRYFT